jgi:hypothetical protein
MLERARIRTRSGPRSAAIVFGVVLAALVAASNASAVTTLAINTAPTLGTLSGVTLNGQTQTTNTTWNLTASPFKITSSGTNSGWNMTVNGNAAGGKSAVFKQYCPPVSAPCGPDGAGYVAGGFTLPADSLSLNTTGATWTAGATKPAYQCNAGACKIDNAAAVKVVSASTLVALGAWTASGSSTLSLATPANLHKLQTNEVYHLDVVWTVSSGP